MNGSWRVVHIAAHGTNDAGGDTATTSGVVLSQRFRARAGDDRPAQRGPRPRGRQRLPPRRDHRQLAGMNRVAASFARRLMQIGVRAVIAAGWAVDDARRRDLRRHPLRELLDGRELGDAPVRGPQRRARHAPRQPHVGGLPVLRRPRLPPRATATDPAPGRAEPHGVRAAAQDPRHRRHGQRPDELDQRLAPGGRRHQRDRLGFDGVEDDLRATLEQLEGEDSCTSMRSPSCAPTSTPSWPRPGPSWAASSGPSSTTRQALAGGGKNVPVTAIEQLANLSMRHAKELSPRPRNATARSRRRSATSRRSTRSARTPSGWRCGEASTRSGPRWRRHRIAADIELAAEKYRAAAARSTRSLPRATTPGS